MQGESTHVGKPCVFVRLTGCPLRCVWCDSEFTFTGGQVRDLEEVAQEAHAHGIRTVEVTGGEPLVQPTAIPLMERLLALGHEVLLETSGALSIRDEVQRNRLLFRSIPESMRDAFMTSLNETRKQAFLKAIIVGDANVFGWAYPSGGGTLGNAIVFGYRAGRHAAARSRRSD